MSQIRIELGDLTLAARLNNTEIARRILDALPIITSGSYWGDEMYFPIPVHAENECPQEEVEVGQLAYWPPGNALCIFYGKTPASVGDKPKAASDVTVIGELESIPNELKVQRPLTSIQISAEVSPSRSRPQAKKYGES